MIFLWENEQFSGNSKRVRSASHGTEKQDFSAEFILDKSDAGRARPYLALDIIRGERLYATDPEACDRFDLYVLRRAADLAPFERQRRRMIFEQARRGTRNREKAP